VFLNFFLDLLTSTKMIEYHTHEYTSNFWTLIVSQRRLGSSALLHHETLIARLKCTDLLFTRLLVNHWGTCLHRGKVYVGYNIPTLNYSPGQTSFMLSRADTWTHWLLSDTRKAVKDCRPPPTPLSFSIIIYGILAVVSLICKNHASREH